MNTTTHNVEVPFPQAFASPPKKRSPFPSAPRYGHASPRQADRHPTARWECALRRGSTLSIRQAAHAQVDTLVLLPTGTIYRGTQRNTIDLSNVQTLPENIALYRMDVHPTQVPNKVGPFIPALKRRGFLGRFL
jgi:hypothetical protein